MLQAAAAAWQRGDHARCIDILEQASGMAPNEAGILFDLGRCHGWCYDYDAANRCFEKAIRVSGWKTAALLEAGRRCLNFFQNEMAGNYFERALKQDEKSVEALVRLAQLRVRHNHLEDAAQLIERALHCDSSFPPALMVRASLYRLSGELAKAEELFRSIVAKPHADVWIRVQAWYEMGATLDRQQRYDDAMGAFLEAKKLLKPAMTQKPVDLKTVHEDLKKTAQLISAPMLQRWHKECASLAPRRRFALLCGHPRSGTTLLEQVLDSHPEIIAAEETPIFHDESFLPLTRAAEGKFRSPLAMLDAASIEQLQQSRANYSRSMDRFLHQSAGNRLLIDKNPSLTTRMPVVLRIFPETKFIVALRDPRDVCLSCFMQPLMPVIPAASVFLTLEGTAAEYAFVMGFWQMMKPLMPAPCLEVRYEDLVNNLESAARRTLEFLEVPWNEQVLSFHQHARHKLVQSPTYAEVRKPVSSGAIGRWRNYQKYLEPHLPALEPFVKAFGYE